MGEVIKDFPRKRRGRPPKYPWDDTFDGQIHRWYQGTDFDVPLDSFRALVHRTAGARGHKAETQLDKNTRSVAFRFFRED